MGASDVIVTVIRFAFPNLSLTDMHAHTLINFSNSQIHGTGGFALVDIPNGTNLIEYVGRKIDKQESLRQCELDNPYIFTLDDQFDLDGNVDWNPARLLNHSCSPNAEALDDDGVIWIVAMRDIKAGEEITFNYNYDLVDYKEHPCRCGSPACVGYIVAEEFFPELQNAIKS
ncbi:MAG: nuclear protein [Pedosphaera sp.]|nr:nuclear protein [Pedosphaera sp.]